MILFVLTMAVAVGSADKSWNNQHDHNNLVDVSGPTSHLERLEVVCSKDHMTVHMHFDHPFYGVVFSHGSPRHERCVHVGPRSGATSVSFNIRYDSCGTIEDLGGQFHENTIVIQFDEDILEAWDQAKRLRCEWLESFEKKSTKPTLAISDLDVVELNFQGDDIDCWMEVQEGKGPWARQVGGLVPIGSPLTLVIAINDHSREFDMRIKRCSASDGTGSEIELTDDRGCVIRSSLLTPFAKIRDFGGKATLVAYSHLFAFKFPDKMDVFVHCIVEVCRHGCPDSCSHQHKSHNYQNTPYSSLESKKIQKLAELAGTKSVHEIHVSGHHQHLKTSALGDEYPLPGRERIREILIPAAQTQVQQFTLKNSSVAASSENVKLIKGNVKATFSPIAFKEAQKAKETKSQEQAAPSSVHNIFVDVENSLHSEEKSKFDFQVLHEHQERPILTEVHQHQQKPIINIGHQHTEKHILNVVHQHQEKPTLNAVHQHPEKNILNVVFQNPEKPTLTAVHQHPEKQILNVVHQHQDKATLNVIHQHPEKHILSAVHQHQEKPILNAVYQHPEKHTLNVVHQHQEKPILNAAHQYQDKPILTAHRIIGHDAHWISETIGKVEEKHTSQSLKDISHQIPQPEPATWSADEVKPIPKPEIFKQQSPQIDTSIHHYHSGTPYISKIQWSADNSKSKEIEDSVLLKQVPQPEPATWTLEEVNPMHNPAAIRLQQHTKRPRPPEPKPEPSTWSLDDVKGFNKEDLRIHSLNYKMKSHTPIVVPVYKEYVHPYSTTIVPQPVYISRVNPRNTSNPSMMKMMMMSTMLPPTYQTAHWPQRTTARYLKPQRHHYPYPIPQFSPHQQMMMSVIADRRMDDEDEDLQAEDLSLYHNLNKDGTEAEIRRIQIGQTAYEPKSSSDNTSIEHQDEDLNKPVTLEDILLEITSEPGTNTNDQTPSQSKVTQDILNRAILSEPNDTVVTVLEYEISTTPETDSLKETSGEMAGPRPAISSFVPPSLDTAVGADPESKDRVVPGPRSLDRRKRSSEPVFGVRQKFQAIAPSDLAFEWNLTTDGTTVLRGIREEIVYGICMSPAGMSASIGFILILTLLSIIASVVFYEHSCQLSNKTSQLAFFTRNFNGQFEALYKFTRPYLYSGSANVR